LLLLAAALIGGLRGESGLAALVLRSALVSFALSFAFIGIGLLLSALARTAERATVYALLAWLTASALHDFALIGALLRTSIPPQAVFALAALNPVEAARITMLGGIDPNLAVLGPVGFWLSNQVAPSALVAVGIGWPLVLGAVCLAGSMRLLQRMDLVG
jgi:ABC-2 type transport system permease protein